MIKTKDGHYRDYIKKKDGTRKWFYGKSSQAVKSKMLAWKEQNEPSSVTFERVASEWWEEITERIAPTTERGYKGHYTRMPAYLPKRIQEIKPADCMSAVTKYQRIYGLGQKSTATFLQVMRQIFQFAVINGYIETNPSRECTVPRGLKRRKVDMPLSEDIERVKANYDAEGGMIAYWALYTGMRRGELLALTWEDVDMERRIIRVNKSVFYKSNHAYLKTPKTDAGTREIPIVDKLYERIKKRGKGLIFGRDGKYMSESMYFLLWERYQKETGVTCTLHQLRHAFATMLYEAELPPRDAMQVLGHAQYSTTMDIYTSIRKQHAEKVSEKIKTIDL